MSVKYKCSGGFKVNTLPQSPFEGIRQHSGGAGSNSSGAGPFGQRIGNTQSADTTSNSNHQSLDYAAVSRALGSSTSQIHQEPSPRSRESPFEAFKQQQQQVGATALCCCTSALRDSLHPCAVLPASMSSGALKQQQQQVDAKASCCCASALRLHGVQYLLQACGLKPSSSSNSRRVLKPHALLLLR